MEEAEQLQLVGGDGLDVSGQEVALDDDGGADLAGE